jgi:hypothetical protein|tara:strand:+ start:355 stop:573 length:219 start_codon:yes stop_codon:yes gene_type:complete
MPFYAQIEKETGYCNAVVESSATLADTDAIQMLLLDELEAKAGWNWNGSEWTAPTPPVATDIDAFAKTRPSD